MGQSPRSRAFSAASATSFSCTEDSDTTMHTAIIDGIQDRMVAVPAVQHGGHMQAFVPESQLTGNCTGQHLHSVLSEAPLCEAGVAAGLIQPPYAAPAISVQAAYSSLYIVQIRAKDAAKHAQHAEALCGTS
jgi:hypothetical protein